MDRKEWEARVEVEHRRKRGSEEARLSMSHRGTAVAGWWEAEEEGLEFTTTEVLFSRRRLTKQVAAVRRVRQRRRRPWSKLLRDKWVRATG